MKKMLGDINWDITKKIMEQISTQNKNTLILWAKEYAYDNYFPVYQKYQKENLAEGLFLSLDACLQKEIPLKVYKALLSQVRKEISLEKDPVAVASIRAITTACAVISTPTNALGFLFYGCAAKAYDALGLKNTDLNYQKYAEKEMENAYLSLLKYSVTDEPDPVKIDWNC